jgi:hypothetical protein
MRSRNNGSWVWWGTAVIPAIQEVETGGLRVPGQKGWVMGASAQWEELGLEWGRGLLDRALQVNRTSDFTPVELGSHWKVLIRGVALCDIGFTRIPWLLK